MEEHRARNPEATDITQERENAKEEVSSSPVELKDLKPNLVILGAQKSGTTSLHRYLHRHPDIFMSNPFKEPGYFWGFDQAKRYYQHKGVELESREQLLKEYMLKGYNHEKYFGESSTFYTIGRYSIKYGIPERIKRECGDDIRFIYLMRNPLSRIISAFLHRKRNKNFSLDLNAYLKSEHGKLDLFTTRYHYQIRHYLEHFSLEKFAFIIFEEFVSDPSTILNQVYRFMDLEEPSAAPNFAAHNKSENKDSFSPNDLIYSEDEYKRVLEIIDPEICGMEEIMGRGIRESWDLTWETWTQA